MAKKYIYFLTLIIIFLLILSGCGSKQAEENLVEESAFLMDTLVKIRVHGKNAEIAAEKSMERIEEIENLMSKTIKESDIYKLNNNPNQKIEISKDTKKVLVKAKNYAEITKGDFDPTIGSLVELWAIGTENAAVPSETELKKALKTVDYRKLIIDDQQALLKKKGLKLDLGGIVKGYAADEVRKILKKNGIEHAFVNLGGNVLVLGNKVDGSPWKIGIQDPRRGRKNVMAVLSVIDKAIVTSGNYERYFEENGKFYHHILDPKTGYPAANNLMSVTIISSKSFDADALSTAVYIMGLEKGMEFVEDLKDVELMFVTKDLNVFLSSGLKEKLKINDPDFKLIEGENIAN